MRKLLPSLFSYLVLAVIFFAPSNLFLTLTESTAYVNGLRIDYLIPKLYLTDLLMLGVVAIGSVLKPTAYKNIFDFKKNFSLYGVGIVLVVAQFFSAVPTISLWLIGKLFLMFLTFYTLKQHKTYLNTQKILRILVASIVLQLIFSVYQFVFQHSLTPFWLTGESFLTSSRIGLARGTFGGEERLLAYGTTPHPNVLAGITTLYCVLILQLNKKRSWLSLITGGITVVILLLTQSVAAMCAFATGLTLLYTEKVSFLLRRYVIGIITVAIFVTPIILMVVPLHTPSLERRIYLNTAALSMFQEHPVSGVGVGNFTAEVEKYSNNPEVVRFIQPVHNIGLLFLAETGILGMIFMYLLFKYLTQDAKLPLLAITLIPLASLDHYLITTHTGLLTMFLFLFFLRKHH